MCCNWLRCSNIGPFPKTGTERMRGQNQCSTQCFCGGSAVARLLLSVSSAMMWALLISHLLWRLLLQQPFCWCLATCLEGEVSPVKLAYLATKLSISCRTIPAKHKTYRLKTPKPSPAASWFMCLSSRKTKCYTFPASLLPTGLFPTNSSGLQHSSYAAHTRRGELPATTQVTSPQDSTPRHIPASLESWQQAESQRQSRCKRVDPCKRHPHVECTLLLS